MSEEEQYERIRDEKKRLGGGLVILGHHYQREGIVALSDFKGDSFALSREAASCEGAEYIVFCGVHFMAESARILASQRQRVFLPAMNAGCPMADMAEIDEVETAWDTLTKHLDGKDIVPVTYMNSSAAIKAFCGEHGGAVCTSSNATKVFSWALDAGKVIFFLPDEHLGRNTSNALGIPKSEQVLWDRRQERGGVRPADLDGARVILWKGFCHVHTHFTLEHVREMRSRHPQGKLVVHPECREEVVAEADYVGSTRFIVDVVEKADPGSTIVIGTEINLVSRLAHENPDKTVLPLSRSLCHNMFKITPAALLWTLESLGSGNGAGPDNEVFVDEDVMKNARIALERMLELA